MRDRSRTALLATPSEDHREDEHEYFLFRRVFFESGSRGETRLGVGVMIPLRIN